MEEVSGTPSVPGVEVFSPRVLRTLYKAEEAILAVYNWLPYPSDIEAEEARRRLCAALGVVDEGLSEVRRLKDELEKDILRGVTA